MAKLNLTQEEIQTIINTNESEQELVFPTSGEYEDCAIEMVAVLVETSKKDKPYEVSVLPMMEVQPDTKYFFTGSTGSAEQFAEIMSDEEENSDYILETVVECIDCFRSAFVVKSEDGLAVYTEDCFGEIDSDCIVAEVDLYVLA